MWAAEHPRREVWVGAPTAATILANRLAPGLLDRYLGRTGYGSQQTDEPADPAAPANLWEPVQDDVDARGRFTGRSHDRTLVAPPISRLILRTLLGIAAALGLRRFTTRRPRAPLGT